MCALENSGKAPLILPRSLENLAIGLKAGVGITSQRSLSHRAGGQPVLVPTVVCITLATGFMTFLTTLATLSALSEERSGDVILTQSFNLDRGALKSLLESSLKDGSSEEIKFEIMMSRSDALAT